MSKDKQPFVEKFRPQTFGEIQGNNTAIKEIRSWAQNWSQGDEPQLLIGEPGVGKTTTAHVLANEMGLNMLDINASDKRTTDEIAEVAEEIRSRTFTGDVQLVVLDEVDSLSGRSNITPLVEQLKNPKNPIILIANEERDIPQSIKNACNVHNFSLRVDSRRAKLRKINDEEDLGLSAPRIQMLAERKNLRDAIQDLQIYAEQDSIPEYQDRSYDRNVFDDMDEILKGNRTRTDEDPDAQIAWLDQNLRDRFRGIEMTMAYRALAEADINLERARRDDYRYWRYAGLLSEKVADLRLTDAYDGYIKTEFPSWWRRDRNNVKKGGTTGSLFRKLSAYEDGRPEMFSSYREFQRFVIPVLKSLSPEEKEQLVAYYGLTEEEAEIFEADDEERVEENETTEEEDDEEEAEQNSALAW